MRTTAIRLLGVVSLFTMLPTPAHAADERALVEVLRSGASIPDKCAACVQLRVRGTTNAIPALISLLDDARTAHAACYALEGIGTAAVQSALREAVVRTAGTVRIGVLGALGRLGDGKAVPVIAPYVRDADPATAAAAAAALGNIGGRAAIEALLAARESVAPALQPVLWDSLLECAERLRLAGDAQAATVFQTVLASTAAAHARTAAWKGIVLADPSRRAELMRPALLGKDRWMHAAALDVLREAKDPALIRACVRDWPSFPETSQLAVLDADVALGKGAVSTVRLAITSPFLPVRIAGWEALSMFGDRADLPALLKAAAGAEPAEREVARRTLARIDAGGGLVAIAQSQEVPAMERAEAYRALGERGDASAVRPLVEGAALENEVLQAAALEALRQMAAPASLGPLLALAGRTTVEARREPMLKALFAVCHATQNKEDATQQVLGAMDAMGPPARRPFLALLGELGTPKALATLQTASRAGDAELSKEAVRVLGRWPNALPAGHLLDLARSQTEPALQRLALRGCIELAGHEPDAARRVALLREALAAAAHPEEKRFALAQLGQLGTAEALELVLPLLKDQALVEEAALASLGVAEKLKASAPSIGERVSAEVLARCRTADVVRRAWALRGHPLGQVPFIQEWVVSGPYAGPPSMQGAQAVFEMAFGPEQRNAPVQWTRAPRGDQVDLLQLFPGRENCAAYLQAHVIVPAAAEAALLVGSDDGVKAWVNGEVVHSNNVDRGMVADQDMAPVRLKQGTNVLLLKITQGGGGWGACARLVGLDGQRIAGLRVEPVPARTTGLGAERLP